VNLLREVWTEKVAVWIPAEAGVPIVWAALLPSDQWLNTMCWPAESYCADAWTGGPQPCHEVTVCNATTERPLSVRLSQAELAARMTLTSRGFSRCEIVRLRPRASVAVYSPLR